MSLTSLPIWFWALLTVTFVVLPLVWFFYRRWLGRLDLRLGVFLKDYLHWRFAAGLQRDTARRLAKQTSRIGFATLKLRDSETRKHTIVSIGFGLAKRSGILVQGQGPQVFPVSGTAHTDRSRDLPPVRPLVMDQLWPQGDRVLEPLEVERNRRDRQVNDLTASFSRLFDETRVSGAIQYRNRLMWESYGKDLDPGTPQLFRSLTPFVFATLFGMLSQQRRLAIEQAIPEDFGGEDSRNLVSFGHLLKSVSGLSPTSGTAVEMALIGTEKRGGSGLSGLLDSVNQTSAPGSVWDPSATSSLALSHLLSLGFGERSDVYKSFVRRTLFDRLGMTNTTLATSLDGMLDSWSGLASTPRDMLRFATLYQSGGFWQGERLLDEAWLDFVHTPVEVSGASGASTHCFLNTGARTGQAVRSGAKIFNHGPPYSSLPHDAMFVLRDGFSLLVIVPSEKLSLSLVSVGKPLTDQAVESFVHKAVAVAQDANVELRAEMDSSL